MFVRIMLNVFGYGFLMCSGAFCYLDYYNVLVNLCIAFGGLVLIGVASILKFVRMMVFSQNRIVYRLERIEDVLDCGLKSQYHLLDEHLRKK
jgi:hypothetical protein